MMNMDFHSFDNLMASNSFGKRFLCKQTYLTGMLHTHFHRIKTERSIEYIKIFSMTLKVESPTVTLRHFPV